ncbi:MAG: glucosaminidase domain-containing protein [Gammaproteobacteria bacterium]|nr:glucosaminidase domain-containing protein [Gammaproteobacteria bacterium]
MPGLCRTLLLGVAVLACAKASAVPPHPAAGHPAWHAAPWAFAPPGPGYRAPTGAPPSSHRPRLPPVGRALRRDREHATPAIPGTAAPAEQSPAADAAAAPATAADGKAAFVARLRPLIDAENARLAGLRRSLLQWLGRLDAGQRLTDDQSARVVALATRYRVDGNPLDEHRARDALRDKIDQIPASLALAQAANESAWGKSRFAREGNNLFGIWTFDESKGMVPRGREAGKKHLVRKFDDEAGSVRYYMFTLNSHPAYAELREIRATLRARGLPLDGLALAAGLTAYSAKGEHYVRLIRDLIERLDLAAHDAGRRDGA